MRIGEMPQVVMLLAWARDRSRDASRAAFWARLLEVAHEALALAIEASPWFELKMQPLVTLPLLESVILRESCKYPGAKIVEASREI